MSNTPSFARRAALALLLTSAVGAQAQVVNGDFSAGLTGWNTLGNASVAGGQLSLDNSGVVADASDLAAQAGISLASLDQNGSQAYEGSLASQSFAAGAGDTLQFNWSFSSDETDLSPEFQDYAFVAIDGQMFRLTGVGDALSSGSFSQILGAGASHTVAFGVVDLGDYGVDSFLTVGGVQVQVTAVPEPTGLALMLAGLGLVGGLARRRKAV
ncbi:PEP-CTERM sorting domain-containing protein [Ideonella sp.]|uniref:PEP-CTERM sorting domain-containing protein n=1 Tax=Ideonella sp. TaxID=1929293 RepID=UPI003BB535A7